VCLCVYIDETMRGDSVNGGPGLAITRVLGAYDQLTNAAPAAWLGAFEEPPLMSLSTESGRCQERAAHTSEPFFTSAHEKVPSAMGGIGGEFFKPLLPVGVIPTMSGEARSSHRPGLCKWR